MREIYQSHVYVLVFVIILMFLSAGSGTTGTLIEDFDDGDFEGWERSPQNEKSKEIISRNDSTYPKGTVALCVQDKVVYYDNIQITGAQIPNINLSSVEPKDKLTTVWGKIKINP